MDQEPVVSKWRGGGGVAGCVLVGGEGTDSSCKPQSASTNAGLRRRSRSG